MAQVRVNGTRPSLVEDNDSLHGAAGLLLEDTLVTPNADGIAYVVLSNPTGCSNHVAAGTTIGFAAELQVDTRSQRTARKGYNNRMRCYCTSNTDRKERLFEKIEKPSLLNDRQTHELLNFLTGQHTAFSLDGLDRGETNLLDMEIHTGDEPPKWIPAQRMPLAVCLEVA